MAVTQCDLADLAANDACTEQFSGISTTIYIGFKSELKAPVEMKASPAAIEDYAHLAETPGFVFNTGKKFYKWEIATDSGQYTYKSNGQNKGFLQTLQFKVDTQDAQVSQMLRVLNNHKDAFILFPEGDKYIAMYNKDRNIKIDDGGISGDSGTTIESESGVTISVSVPSIVPKLYYAGTVSTTAASGA